MFAVTYRIVHATKIFLKKNAKANALEFFWQIFFTAQKILPKIPVMHLTYSFSFLKVNKLMTNYN